MSNTSTSKNPPTATIIFFMGSAILLTNKSLTSFAKLSCCSPSAFILSRKNLIFRFLLFLWASILSILSPTALPTAIPIRGAYGPVSAPAAVPATVVPTFAATFAPSFAAALAVSLVASFAAVLAVSFAVFLASFFPASTFLIRFLFSASAFRLKSSAPLDAVPVTGLAAT